MDPSVNGHLTIHPTRYQASPCVLDDHHFSCTFDSLGEAVGGGCRALADTYGPDFKYPCTATAELSGEFQD